MPVKAIPLKTNKDLGVMPALGKHEIYTYPYSNAMLPAHEAINITTILMQVL